MTQGCRDGIGGVKSVYVGNWSRDLEYSFQESDVFRISNMSGQFPTYRIEYTEPLGPTAPNLAKPIRPLVGDIVTVQLDDPRSTFSSLNGTSSVTIAGRGTGGVTLIFTDRGILGVTAGTPGLTGTTGRMIYSTPADEITVLPVIDFWKIAQPEETAEYIQTVEENQQTNSTVWNQELTVNFYDLGTTRSLIKTLCQGTWVILIEDNESRWWLMGYDDGCQVSDFNVTTGKGRGDLNGSRVTFLARSGSPAFKVRQSATEQRIQE